MLQICAVARCFLPLAIAACVAAMPSIGAAQPALPPDRTPILQTSPILAAEVIAAGLAFERRMIDIYNAREDRDQTHDERVHQAMEIITAWLANAPGARTLPLTWRWASDLAISRECDDPMIRALYIQMHHLRGQKGASTLARATQYAADLDRSNYAAHRRAMMQFTLGNLHTAAGSLNEAAAAYSRGSNLLVEALSEPGLTPLEQRYVAARVLGRLEQLPVESAWELLAAVEEGPGVEPWVRHLAAGRFHIRLAWDARTNRVARRVTPEGWEGFRQHLATAREHLTTAHKLEPGRPEAATHMITIAMAGHALPGESIYTWFDRAVAAQFDYEPAYAKVLWALRPRWGGSYSEMLTFAERCAATERYDTSVPLQFLNTVQTIITDSSKGDLIWREHGILDAAAKVIEGSAADPAHEHRRGELLGMLAGIAWHAGDPERGRAALEQDARLADLTQGLVNVNAPAERVRAELFLSGGETAEPLRAALLHMAEGRWQDARQELQLRGIRVMSGISRHVQHLRAMAEVMTDFAGGEWRSLNPGEAGWEKLAGQWRPLQTQPTFGLPGDEGLMTLLDAPIGSRYEARCTIDLSGMREGFKGNAGLVLDFRRTRRTDEFVAVRILGASNRVCIGRQFTVENTFPLPPALDPEHPTQHQIHVAVWDRSLLVRVNGQKVYAGPHRVLRASDQGRFGVGGYFRWAGLGQIGFMGLEVRRLDEPPAGLPIAPDADLEEMLELAPPDDEESGLFS